MNELGVNNNLKVAEDELKNEIQKQIQSMPGQEKQVLEYFQKNPSATSSLRGSIYEDKILNLIKIKSKQIKKIITLEEADKILKIAHDKNHDRSHEHPVKTNDKIKSKKTKNLAKSSPNKKKIRKK